MTFYHGVHAFFEVTEGSLKWYTDFPPVLDRFKKTFLHGISGRLKYFLVGLISFSGNLDCGCRELSLLSFLFE
ncbi:uncharacterized protein METZ01_LOCUS161118 [marine metagenome]|uniref:Uncharacterized protein n=1 Tax=marine metagenome TaxID=408172 RepID=A0A382B3U0_9ZZZZ